MIGNWLSELGWLETDWVILSEDLRYVPYHVCKQQPCAERADTLRPTSRSWQKGGKPCLVEREEEREGRGWGKGEEGKGEREGTPYRIILFSGSFKFGARA